MVGMESVIHDVKNESAGLSNESQIYAIPPLKPAEFLDCLHDRLQLFNDCVHRMLLIVHLLREREYGLRLGFRHNGHSVTIGNNDISRIHRDAIAEQWDLRSCKPVVMHRGGGNNSSGENGETNLAQVGDSRTPPSMTAPA